MTIAEAQQDSRRAYVGGGPGVFVSGLVWLAAAVVLRQHGTASAFYVLFFGGMLIFGVTTLLCRFIFRRSASAPGNPLGRVALESTMAMIGGLIAAWILLSLQPSYVFPLAAIAVGTHYAAFRTVYGDASFWVLGGLITIVGCLGIFTKLYLPGGQALAVGIIEVCFGIILAARALRSPSNRR